MQSLKLYVHFLCRLIFLTILCCCAVSLCACHTPVSDRRSNSEFWKLNVWNSLKDRLLQSIGITMDHLGFRRRTCHEPSQCECYIRFSCPKPKFVWVDLESLPISLVWHNSSAPVWSLFVYLVIFILCVIYKLKFCMHLIFLSNTRLFSRGACSAPD